MSQDYFKNTKRFLQSLQSPRTITTEIEIDKDGFYDKECPNAICLSKFKVFADDWVNKIIPHNECHCPFCGHIDGYNSWWTTEQIEQAKKQAVEQLGAELGAALNRDAKQFNSAQPKNSFLKMSMRFSGQTQYINLPIESLETMQQKIVCEKCGTRYAVIGAAFFCPTCGHNSASKTFNNTIDKVNAKISNVPLIKSVISETNKDGAETTCQSLIESSVSDLVVALQRLCECVYPQLPNAQPLKKNVFQRLDDSNILWKQVCGKDYKDWLTTNEYSLLVKCFQQRHILQHKDGIIDNDYILKSGDTLYCVGQRLVVKESDISTYSSIISKLGQIIISLI